MQERHAPDEVTRDRIAEYFFNRHTCLACGHDEGHHTEYDMLSYLMLICADDGCPCLVFWPLR